MGRAAALKTYFARRGLLRGGLDSLHPYGVMVSPSRFHPNAHRAATIGPIDLRAPSWRARQGRTVPALLAAFLRP